MSGHRKTISSRRRFDVFKRDGFRCVYCGGVPPAATLHADHVLAVSNGGSDDLTNLVTSCADCNLGKSAEFLATKPEALSIAQDAERDRFDQLREYNEWQAERAHVKEIWFRQVSDAWITLDGADPAEWGISAQRASTVRVFLDRLPVQEIIDALHIANARYSIDDNHFFKYFCGVCWNKIKKAAKP